MRKALAGAVSGFLIVGLSPQYSVATAQESVAVMAQAGLSPEQVMAAISTPFAVPAGQTTVIQLPVAASASYSDGAWAVSTSGQTVTITAPPEGGTISVPVTAQGRSATITLIAEPAGGDVSGGASGGASGESGSGPGEQPGTGEGGTPDAGTGAGAADTQSGANSGASGSGGQAGGGASPEEMARNEALPVIPGVTPDRQPAQQVEESNAQTLYLESRIEGQVISV